MDVVVRSEGEPGDLATLLRAEVRTLDPSLPVASIRTMEEVVAASVAQPRLLASLVAAFAAIALVLATVGIYGVIAYLVGRRKQEFGIRMALGAGSARVVRMVLREGAWMVATGLLVGAGASLLLSRAASGALYGVVAADVATLVSVSALLAGVALLAIIVPARRATRVDPALPLRGE
jgi:ABC-type antimicrobial peptide transport system permease subunit